MLIPGWSEGPDLRCATAHRGILRGSVAARPPRNDDEHLSHINKARRALFDVGADGLELIGSAHQFHLLNGFG
jgi:hypothetical protein